MTTTPHVERYDGARIVVLISGSGSNLAAILAAHQNSDYGGKVVGVISDQAAAGGLEIARQGGIPTAVVQPKDFADRDAWNAALAQAVAVFNPDWVVCAGFMRILGEPFLQRFGGKTINTHPALLPSFPGAHGVRDALAHGVKITGCTVHVVDAGVDTGPIIAQVTVEVLDGDTEAELHERIKGVERDLLVTCIGRICRQGLTVEGRRALIRETPLQGSNPLG